MLRYQKIIKFIQKEYFNEESLDNKFLLDIGKDHLQTLTKKIIYFEFFEQRDSVEQISQNISKIIINEIGVSDQKHLEMCIGKAFKQKNYQILDKIQPEIKECIINYIQNPYALKLKHKKEQFKNERQIKKQKTRFQSGQSENKQSSNSNYYINRKRQFWKSQSEIKKQLTFGNDQDSWDLKQQKKNNREKQFIRDQSIRQLFQILDINKKNSEQSEDEYYSEEGSSFLIRDQSIQIKIQKEKKLQRQWEQLEERISFQIENQEKHKKFIEANDISMQQLSSIREKKDNDESFIQEEKDDGLTNFLQKFKEEMQMQDNQENQRQNDQAQQINDQSMQQQKSKRKIQMNLSSSEDEI